MRTLIFLFWVLLSTPAVAEVFKCTEKHGKTVYQNTPCKPDAKEQQLDIKTDPAKEAEAKAKLDMIRNEYDARKAAQAEEDKVQSAKEKDALSLEFARRNAIAQEQQAQAQQRQAEALENQNQPNNRSLYFWPYPSRHLPSESVRSPLIQPSFPQKQPNRKTSPHRVYPFKPH